MFEIDPVTLTVSILLLCTFCAPFYYYSNKNNQKNKHLIKKLHELAGSSEANLSEFETWRTRYGIGVDSQKNVLVYFQTGEEDTTKILNLNEFKKVNLLKNYPEEKSGKLNYRIPESVSIELLPKADSSAIHRLEFYHADHFTDLQGETVLADKWYQTIKNQIHS